VLGGAPPLHDDPGPGVVIEARVVEPSRRDLVAFLDGAGDGFVLEPGSDAFLIQGRTRALKPARVDASPRTCNDGLVYQEVNM
jgi:hypothetical protein